ncbi:UNVERIFIED_CONTAM: hypothetical protein FKN15_052509 [Acipenser sinensis]
MQRRFGASSPPFLDYLKDILRRYPDGGQILKELIQNADDACATEVAFLYDERTFEAKTLWNEDLKKFQGPALYAYNNAVFSSEDWGGIQSTGRSIKRKDPNKVGRFGIGFNSVYHITDLPSIFSGKHLGMLDPQEKLFGEREGGYMWSLDDAEDRDQLMNFHDQFLPFRSLLGEVSIVTWEEAITAKQDFPGTLFRFPLRNEPSAVSDQLYDTDKIVKLFDSFSVDADMSLLFLRNVSSISLKHIDSQGNVSLLLRVTATHPIVDLTSSKLLSSENESHFFSKTEGATCLKVISVHCSSKGEGSHRWLVTSSCIKKGQVPELDVFAEKLSFYPQVGLAFPLDQEETLVDGRLSCFLPLPNNEPNRTGFPVHVNACFGLTDNRRNIKWLEEDQRHDEAAKWNELLVQEFLPLAYLQIILDAISLSRNSVLPASTPYQLWPDLHQMKHKERWQTIATKMFEQLVKLEVLFLADETKCVKPADAIFLPPDIEGPRLRETIKDFLITEGEFLAEVPPHVFNAIQATFESPESLQVVTPGFVRKVLHQSSLTNLTKDDKLFLLEYVISDGQYHELKGLQLLPLSDGSFTFFEEDALALIENEKFPRVLLPGFGHVFVQRDLSTNLLHHLKKLADNEMFKKIFNLNKVLVAKLIGYALPQQWMQCSGHVTWDIGNTQHPPAEWITKFWKFLNSHFETLNDFKGLPLIPLSPLQGSEHSAMLARLMENPTVVFQNDNQSSLSDEIADVIRRAGGTVIQSRDTCLKHPDLEKYILTPSPRNLLQLLLNLDGNQVICGTSSSSMQEKEELKNCLCTMASFSQKEKRLLLTLPIFQQMPSRKCRNGDLIAAGSYQAVIQNDFPVIPGDLPMPEVIIKCANEVDQRLLSMMNVRMLTVAMAAVMLVDGIEKGLYGQNEMEKIMSWILENGSILFAQEKDLYKKCFSLCFIVTERGTAVQASSLFDPSNETFQDLFNSEFFPPAVYATKETILQSLCHLGLKCKEESITPKDVLNVAREINHLHVSSRDKAYQKAEALIKVCNQTDVLSKCSAEEIRQLCCLEWVPCSSPATMIENQETTCFYKPEDLRHSKFFRIVGLVMPLTDKLNEKASTNLGLLSLPPAEKVMGNLSVLNKVVHEMTEPDADIDFKDQIHCIYIHMLSNLPQFKSLLRDTAVPWVWIGDQFSSPQRVILSYPAELDLGCYITKVPQEFSRYKKLLSECGVKKSISEREVIEILYHMKDRIDQRITHSGSPAELKVILSVLNWIRKVKKLSVEDLPVPVRKGKQGEFSLKPLSMTVFCDIAKEGLEDLDEDDEEYYIIHEEIPRVTAEWLRVPFLSTRILNPEFIGIEQCGQTEPITLRIKNILKEYDEECDLFKELIQNADDAQATTCSFMMDCRPNKDSFNSLIDPGMSSCHGPCLWSFNNEVFTDEDFKNITEVGAASKENKVEKIGKFGLGFNAVYRVTDIPTILSGKNLLIFDPNVTHLKKHILSSSNPGIKLDLCKKRLLRRFPGQFKPYHGIYGCNLEMDSQQEFYFQGTLIKLPFRTLPEAQESKISSTVYDQNHVLNIMNRFIKSATIILLFLKNLSNVSFKNLPENASSPPHNEHLESVLTITRKVVNSIPIPDHIKQMQESSQERLTKINAKCRELIDCNAVNIIEVAKGMKGNEPSAKYWLVYSCFGMKNALKMACVKENWQTFSLPIGSVAVPLEKDKASGHWVPDKHTFVGQVFCFLPLSILSGLPVHVNGSFSVTSNRKSLWDTGVKNEWNQALIGDAVTSAYIVALVVLKEMSQEEKLKNYDYHTFWPNTKEANRFFHSLVAAFYSTVVNGLFGFPVELFSDGKDWCSLENARFLDPQIERNKQVGQIAVKVFSDKLKKPCLAIPLPQWVRESLDSTGWDSVIREKTFGWHDFYREIVFVNLRSMDSKYRNTLILFAIDMNDPEVDGLLKKHPCIPTLGGKQLQFIGKLVKPGGKVACLFEKTEGRLLEGTAQDFCSPQHISRLLALGMLDSCLPWDDLIERAKIIENTWKQDKDKAYKQVRCILDLANDFLSDTSFFTGWPSLGNIAFIPSLLPYRDVHGKVVEPVTLKKPNEVYNYESTMLVNMTQHIIDQEKLYPKYFYPPGKVLNNLGVLHRPSCETVIHQLKTTQQYSDVLDGSLLSEIASVCYKYLDTLLKKGTNSKHFSVESSKFPFILIGQDFVYVNAVAKQISIDASPYLHELPKPYATLKNLWKCFGVKSVFTSQDYLSVLRKLAAKYNGCSLSASDLAICLRIVSTGLNEIQDSPFEDYLLPDQNGVLYPSTQLFYNDTPWLPVAEGITLCHDHISRSTAVCLRIQTTKHHTLQNQLVSPFPFYPMAFGQREKLTVRLKNIIAAYPSKKDILKELLQNADDAEATEIHFVWDPRNHNTLKTFGEKWNPLQGPALCVYNNKIFTETDLEGIQHLGEGGKSDILGKTGKYGLGFNSVYHLTDCPSILTGDKWLCIFDPHLTYLENANNSPGGMFSMEGNFKVAFEDVYTTFMPSAFDLNQGTMFRLPVRTEEMASTSEISQKAVTSSDIQQLLDALKEDPEGLILFLRHVKKIEFHQFDSSTNEMKKLFTTEIKLAEESSGKKTSFQNHVKNSLVSGCSMAAIEPCQVIYEMEISTPIRKPTRWIIAEQFGTSLKTTGYDSKVPQGAVAACVSALVQNSKAFCSLPLPVETGLPVQVNGNFEVDPSRRGLWKEDGTSLKTAWNEFLKLNVIAPLYADLLDYIRINHLKERALSLNSMILNLENSYLRFFPHITELQVAQEWHGMINELYKSLSKRGLCVIPVFHTSQHCPTQTMAQCMVSWSSISKKEQMNAPHLASQGQEGLILILEGIGMNLVPTSESMIKIFDSFRRAEVKVYTLIPQTVRNYLKSKPLNNPSQSINGLPLPLNQTLIKSKFRCKMLLDYCLSDIEKNNSSCLNGLPLLLTQDKVLRVFETSSSKYLTKFMDLFEGSEELFADYSTYLRYFPVLCNAMFLKELTISDSAEYLKSILEDHLQNTIVDPQSSLHIPSEILSTWLKRLWEYFEDQVASCDKKSKKESSQLDEIKELFSDSPIVPIICPNRNNQHLLATVKSLHTIVCQTSHEVAAVLYKLGFATLDVFSFPLQLFRCHLMSELLSIDNADSVLEQLCKREKQQFDQLDDCDFRSLQLYLHSGIKSCANTKTYLMKFKSLPLFETLQEGRQRIDRHSRVYILKTEQLLKFPSLYHICDGTAFLKYNSTNVFLAETMEIPVINDLEFYVRFVLPALNRLSEKQTLDAVCMCVEIQEGYSDYIQFKEEIISCLRNAKFIKDARGSLQPASYFYDEEVHLYQLMISKERFIPRGFWENISCKSQKFKDLLKDIGLKHRVSDEEFVEFAYQIEKDAKGRAPLEQLMVKSDALLERLLSKSLKQLKKCFLNIISTIKFIYPQKIDKMLCSYHQPFAEGRNFIAMRGSLIKQNQTHETLIWTAMPVLPLENSNTRQLQILQAAGALCLPPAESVTANLKNICQIPCKTKEVLLTRAKVFRCSYGYLQELPFDGQSLVDLPVILVEGDAALVKPSRTVQFVKDDSEFRPYLYKLPSKLALYVEFFRKLGVAEEPSAWHYSSLLKDIYQDSADMQTLHANQMKAVKRAVQHLFLLLKENSEEHKPEKLEPLYLLAMDGRLYESSSLYFNDVALHANRCTVPLKEKLKLLENLSECHLGIDPYVHQELLQVLPVEVRPKMLSQVTKEDLMKSTLSICEYGDNCRFRGHFHRLLASSYFQNGLVCILRGQCSGKMSENDTITVCKNTFAKIQILCCERLETVLFLNSEPLRDTAAQKQVYVNRNSDGCVFYLEHKEDMDIKVMAHINMCLTKEINALLNNGLSQNSLLIFSQLLFCETEDDVMRLLEENGIHGSRMQEKSHSGLPEPGSLIPDEWIDSLDMDFLNNFEVGEYVGYKEPSPEEEVYCYAVVVEHVNTTAATEGVVFQRYKIQIGQNDFLEVSSLDLYQFKRPESSPSLSKNTCRELVVLDHPVGARPNHSRTSEKSLEEIKKEIDERLKEIWGLPEDERCKAIRRLYLKWHPDKNLDNTKLAEEVYKYIRQKIEELEQGRSGKGGGFGSTTTNQRHSGAQRYQDTRSFFKQWDKEASRHRTGRTSFHQRDSSQEFNFWTFHSRQENSQTNSAEAQRWVKQAKCDLAAASNDMGHCATEWVLFKVHQAVEKALIAAEYKTNGLQPSNCAIGALARQVSQYSLSLCNLPSIVSRMKTLGVDGKKTQYPNYHPLPLIPSDSYSAQNEQEVLDLANEVLTKIQKYIS